MAFGRRKRESERHDGGNAGTGTIAPAPLPQAQPEPGERDPLQETGNWEARWASFEATSTPIDESGPVMYFADPRLSAAERREQRFNQQLPQDARTREMATMFVSRFRHGGTVGMKTPTKRILRMKAVPEQDIPIIKKRLKKANLPYNIAMFFFGAVVVAMTGVLVFYFGSLAQNDGRLADLTAQFTKPVVKDESVDVAETDMPPIVDFAGLQKVNPEVSSWLRVPGTTIDYPVMTTTEEAKYLRKDIYGDYSVPGCLFTDWTNQPDMSDSHIVIYGHHLPWPAMFHDMSLYLEEDGFFDAHRKMYFETPETTYVLKVIGLHKAMPKESEARWVEFTSEQQFQEYLDQRLAANNPELVENNPETCRDTGDYDRKTMDKFFTFITCTDSGSARCIVNAIVTEQYPTSHVPLVRAKMMNHLGESGDAVPTEVADNGNPAEFQTDAHTGTVTRIEQQPEVPVDQQQAIDPQTGLPVEQQGEVAPTMQ